MGKFILIACTNVGRSIIETVMNDAAVQSELVGIVNLKPTIAINKANYDPYFDLVEKYTIPIHYCDDVNDAVTLDWMRALNPDVIIQSGWSQKFGNELLDIPKYGCIGEHPAPLPRGRGAACVNWAILTGETDWGDSFFQMVEKYDAGVLYAQNFFNIEHHDNVKTIYDKVAFSAQTIMKENIDFWTEGKFNQIEQDESKVTYYKRRRPEDGQFNFQQTAKVLHDFIRAQTAPYPGAFFILDGKKITVWQADVGEHQDANSEMGVLSEGENGSVYVQCDDGSSLELIRVQEEGFPTEWANDWVKRRKLEMIKI